MRSDDRLVFANILTAPALADITFNGVGGASQISLGGGYYEITSSAVPEPTTVFGALALLGLVGYRERRRLGGLISSRLVG